MIHQKKTLPIKSFVGDRDEYFRPGGKIYSQWTEVSLATSNGYENISENVIPKKSHEPMPMEVMDCFLSLQKK